jgi:hypothetical protein
MALNFDLVQALNNVGTSGQAVFGAFKAGYYIGYNPNTFAVFQQYRYRIGSADPYLQPLNTGMELGWFSNIVGQNQYPHLAVENINGNAEITPSLWGQSMYFHPGTLNDTYSGYTNVNSRPCVVRFTSPVAGTITSIIGNFLKGLYFSNPATGFTIFKNGVAIFTRVVVTSGNSVAINLTNISVLQGDVIDFVVDVAEGSGSQDDSAMTVNLSLQLAQTTTPIPNPATLNCTDTVSSGTINLVQSGTVTLQTVGGGTILGVGNITPIVGTVNGQWSITGLDLSTYGAQTLEYVALDAPSTVSTPVTKVIGNVGCVACVVPTITTQPIGAVVCTGSNHTMSVIPAGTSPFTYQWQDGGVDIVGETNSSITVNVAADYTVVVTNACGSITSNIATVSFIETIAIVSTPTTLIKCPTASTTLSGGAITGDSPTYQWFLNNVAIVGETNSTITVTAAGIYKVTVSNSCNSVTSANRTISNYVGYSFPVFNLPIAQQGIAYNYTVSLLGNGGSVNLVINTKPTWMSIVVSGTDIVFSGTPNNTNSIVDISVSSVSCPLITASNVAKTLITADATADTFTISQNQTLNGTVTGNDTLCTGGTTTLSLAVGAINGSLTFNSNGTFQYIPNINYSGADSFSYNIECDNQIVDTVSVLININGYVGDAVNDTFTTNVNVQATGNLSLNDTPSLIDNTYWALLAGSEVNGTAVVNQNGVFTFTSPINSTLQGQFIYELRVGTSFATSVVIDTAIVTINISCNAVLDYVIISDEISYIGQPEAFTVSNILPTNASLPLVYSAVAYGGNIVGGQGTNQVVVVFTQHIDTRVVFTVTSCGTPLVKEKIIRIGYPPCPTPCHTC